MTHSSLICTFANGTSAPPVTVNSNTQTICLNGTVWQASVPATLNQILSYEKKPDPTKALAVCDKDGYPDGNVYIIPSSLDIQCVNSTVYTPYVSSAKRGVPDVPHVIIMFLILSLALSYS